MTLHELLKSIVLLLVLAYSAPFFLEHIKTNYLPLLEPYTHIGLINIKSSLTNSSDYLAKINSFFKNPSIKGIIIALDCHECALGTSQTLFYEIQELKKTYPKPLISVIENECLSESYLIASTCDYIIAPETALIGGIGIYTMPPQMQLLCQDETTYNEIYQQTTRMIAMSRKLSLATVENWAHKKIFTGKQALKLGLITHIGSMHTAIKILKEKAPIEGEINWITHDNYLPTPISISLFATNVQ